MSFVGLLDRLQGIRDRDWCFVDVARRDEHRWEGRTFQADGRGREGGLVSPSRREGLDEQEMHLNGSQGSWKAVSMT